MKLAWPLILLGLLVAVIKGQNQNELLFFNKSNSLLPSNTIQCIAIDSTNNVWIGTDNGLVKYDGRNWEIFNMQNGLVCNSVSAIAVDNNNNIWIVDSLLSKYDRKTWYHFVDNNSANNPTKSKLLAIDINNNKWLVRNANTLVSFDGNDFSEKVKLNGDILSLSVINDEVWFNTQTQVYSYKSNALKNWNWNKSNQFGGVNKVIVDAAMNKWIVTSIYLTSGDSWNYTYSLQKLIDPANYQEYFLNGSNKYGLLQALAFEGETKWAGIYYYGFVKVSAKSGWQVLGNFNVVWNIIIDKNNNKWIVHGGGLAVYRENGVVFTEIKNDNSTIPTCYALSQNFPNPFNPETTISYSIPKSEHVTLKVYDVLGREVATFVDEYKQAGSYKQIFNVKTRHGVSLQSGVYFYQLQAGSYSETKKLIVLK